MYLPLKEEISKLLHPIDNDLLHKASRPFFNDVNDHCSLYCKL